jgi:hypothetical protein
MLDANRLAGQLSPHQSSAGCASCFRRRSRARPLRPESTGTTNRPEIASQGGISAEIRETRPNNHNPARSASCAPFTGRRPVQFGIAVSKKPAMAAITKPNSISWTCQASGSRLVSCSRWQTRRSTATAPTRPQPRGEEERPKAVGKEGRHRTMQGRAGGERVHWSSSGGARQHSRTRNQAHDETREERSQFDDEVPGHQQRAERDSLGRYLTGASAAFGTGTRQ